MRDNPLIGKSLSIGSHPIARQEQGFHGVPPPSQIARNDRDEVAFGSIWPTLTWGGQA